MQPTTTMEEALSSKRPREEGNGPSSYLEQFLAYDTDKLAAVGRQDAAVIAELEKFSNRLQTSISAVKKILDEEQACKAMEKKIMDDKLAKKSREERTKQRQQLIAESRCFQCNVFVDGKLNSCVEYEDNTGASGDGVLFCDTCCEKVKTHSCHKCRSFLHEDLDKNLCGGASGNCNDDHYTCHGCKKFFCLPCAEFEMDGETCEGNECCGHKWYCEECTADSNFGTVRCYKCDNEGKYICENCARSDLRKCEGECNKPVCDGCVRRLACGNDVRLCGSCFYYCEMCSMCEEASIFNESPWR